MLSKYVIWAASYFAGIYLTEIFDIFSIVLFSCAFIFICVLRKFVFKRRNGVLIAAAVLLAFGGVYAAAAGNAELEALYPFAEKYAEMDGIIVSAPSRSSNEKYSYTVTVKEAARGEQTIYPNEKIRLTCSSLYKPGDKVRFSGVLKAFSGKMNSLGFDSDRYYRTRKIKYKMYSEAEPIVLGTESPADISFIAERLRYSVGKIISTSYKGVESGVLHALLLADKTEFSAEYRNLFESTGIMRYLRSSYMNIFVISLLAELLLGGRSKRTRDIARACVLIIYAFMHNSSGAAVKNALMTILSIAVVRRYGFLHFPDVMALTALAAALANPLFAFDPGFGVAVAGSVIHYCFKIPMPRLKCRKPLRLLLRLLFSWISSTVLLLPAVVYFFDGAYLWTGLFAGLLLIINSCTIIVSAVALPLNYFFGIGQVLLKIPVGAVVTLAKIIERLPFHLVYFPKPSILFILLYYMLCAAVIGAVYGKRKISPEYAAMLGGGAVAYVLCTVISLGTLSVTFVNVGQGDGAVLHMPLGETVIIDGGGTSGFSDYNMGENVFLPYLMRHGYGNIDLAVVTHYHSDHCLGVLSAVESLRVKRLLLPSYEDSTLRPLLERAAEENGTEIIYAEYGDELSFSSGLSLSVLSPDEQLQASEDENDRSVIVSAEYCGHKILFMGDATAEAEKIISGSFGKTDILKVGHHGSRGASSEELLAETLPEYAVISVGENNSYNLPSYETLLRLENAGAEIVRTDKAGDVRFKVGKGITYDTYYGEN